MITRPSGSGYFTSRHDSHSEAPHAGCDTKKMNTICPICEGAGWKIVRSPNGTQYAEDCVCRMQQRSQRMLQRAQIPRRYEHCTLESFDTRYPTLNFSLDAAKVTAKGFLENYLNGTDGKGLMMVGPIGVGKTHLAVGVLQALIEERGANGLFYDYRDLLKQVQNSYNPQVSETELGVLRPVFEAEVLVLDELGASKPTDWVWDTVAHILNTRYNDRRTTIITTNYQNAAPLETDLASGGNARGSAARAAMREETLGDRIGERMRSRLQEMCLVVEMQGEDFRQKVKRVRFA